MFYQQKLTRAKDAGVSLGVIQWEKDSIERHYSSSSSRDHTGDINPQ